MWQSPSHPPSHVAVAITLNAQASSLKSHHSKAVAIDRVIVLRWMHTSRLSASSSDLWIGTNFWIEVSRVPAPVHCCYRRTSTSMPVGLFYRLIDSAHEYPTDTGIQILHCLNYGRPMHSCVLWKIFRTDHNWPVIHPAVSRGREAWLPLWCHDRTVDVWLPCIRIGCHILVNSNLENCSIS